jgi:predicted dehydrogenase
VNTPKPVWNPEFPQPIDFYQGWEEIPDTMAYPNAFRVEWEMFLRYLVGERPDFRWNLEAGARGVQLAEAGLQSWHERRWIDLPKLEY